MSKRAAQHVAVSWGEGKAHLVRPRGRTACGRKIPAPMPGMGWWDTDAIVRGSHGCRMCRRVLEPARARNASRKQTTRELAFAGYRFDAGPSGTTVRRDYVDTARAGDYGCDPLGDGRFRMVPSGDVVDREEKERRLRGRNPSRKSTKAKREAWRRGEAMRMAQAYGYEVEGEPYPYPWARGSGTEAQTRAARKEVRKHSDLYGDGADRLSARPPHRAGMHTPGAFGRSAGAQEAIARAGVRYMSDTHPKPRLPNSRKSTKAKREAWRKAQAGRAVSVDDARSIQRLGDETYDPYEDRVPGTFARPGESAKVRRAVARERYRETAMQPMHAWPNPSSTLSKMRKRAWEEDEGSNGSTRLPGMAKARRAARAARAQQGASTTPLQLVPAPARALEAARRYTATRWEAAPRLPNARGAKPGAEAGWGLCDECGLAFRRPKGDEASLCPSCAPSGEGREARGRRPNIKRGAYSSGRTLQEQVVALLRKRGWRVEEHDRNAYAAPAGAEGKRYRIGPGGIRQERYLGKGQGWKPVGVVVTLSAALAKLEGGGP